MAQGAQQAVPLLSPMANQSRTATSTARAVQASRTIVVGLGNPLLSDDAVGLRVAALLQELIRADPVAEVTVVTSTRAGFELIDLLAGARHAIIVDCLEVPDPEPGRIRRLDLQRVAGSARLVGAHDLDVAAAFRLATAMGISMPDSVEIYAVEAAETRRFNERLTPAVETAAAMLARDLHALLKERA